MAYAEIVEEAKGLSERSAAEVLDFIKFLKSKEDKEDKAERKSNLLSGGLKYMAEDFDETPSFY
ncbi:MAG: DUF2281 domain-containing protein [Lachnospiraceae bacterium]|nr:DUF2281 domain-containing protein [Lachnospiraceae bacterium]